MAVPPLHDVFLLVPGFTHETTGVVVLPCRGSLDHPITIWERVTASLGIRLWMVLEKSTSTGLEMLYFMLYFRDY